MARIAAALIILLFLLSACPAAPAPQHLMSPPTHYFPITLGTKWEYSNGETQTITKVDEHDSEYVVTVSELIENRIRQSWLYKVSKNGLFRVSDNFGKDCPARSALRLPFKTGMQWHDEKLGEWKCKYLAFGPEEVKVKAGTYKAIRVEEYTELINNGVGGRPLINHDPSKPDVRWYAPGVGLVKYKHGSATGELKSFKLGESK